MEEVIKKNQVERVNMKIIIVEIKNRRNRVNNPKGSAEENSFAGRSD